MTNGYYFLMDARDGGGHLAVSRLGYVPYSEQYTPPAGTTTWKNVGLAPAYVANAHAAQRSGTRLVDITYDLDAPADDVPVVTLDASPSGGLTWSIRPVSVSGDVGTNAALGAGRRVVWDAGGLGRNGVLADDGARLRRRPRPGCARAGLDAGAHAVRL